MEDAASPRPVASVNLAWIGVLLTE